MSDAGVDDGAVAPILGLVTKHWWRATALVATVVMAAFSWHDPLVAVFAAVPVLVWCLVLARSDRPGMVVALGLTALAAWILLPRGLGLSGQWVPSVFEVCAFLPLLVVAVCMNERRARRSVGCLPVMGFSAFAVAGILVALHTWVLYSEGDTGDEGVWPGPPGLQVVEADKACGSGGCARKLDATGDRARERVRAYLASRGFTTPGLDDEWTCRVTGLLLPYEVCAKVEDISPTTVRMTWSI